LLAAVELSRPHDAAVLSEEVPRAMRLAIQLKATVPDAAIVVIRDVRNWLGCLRHARIIALEQGAVRPRSTNELAFDWSGDGTWCELRENHVLRQDNWSRGRDTI
jgi:hypothetical protein